MTNPGGNIFDAPTHSTVGEEDYRHPANYRPGDPREPAHNRTTPPNLKTQRHNTSPYLTEWPYTPT